MFPVHPKSTRSKTMCAAATSLSGRRSGIKNVTKPEAAGLSGFAATESAQGIDDEANYQDQANSAAAENRAAKIKSTATEQQQQNKDKN